MDRARETKFGGGKQAKRSHNAMRMLAGHLPPPISTIRTIL
jgi:hypothetical protein